jgi:hypothetical protein
VTSQVTQLAISRARRRRLVCESEHAFNRSPQWQPVKLARRCASPCNHNPNYRRDLGVGLTATTHNRCAPTADPTHHSNHAQSSTRIHTVCSAPGRIRPRDRFVLSTGPERSCISTKHLGPLCCLGCNHGSSSAPTYVSALLSDGRIRGAPPSGRPINTLAGARDPCQRL